MRVGFIGVGYMGRHMARNIAKGDHQMSVFDIRKEAADELLAMGASWAESPRDVAGASEVVFTSLPRPRDVEEVATGEGGVFSGAAPGTACFDLSTTDVETIKRIAAAGHSKGVEFLDAPISGQRYRRRGRGDEILGWPCSTRPSRFFALLLVSPLTSHRWRMWGRPLS